MTPARTSLPSYAVLLISLALGGASLLALGVFLWVGSFQLIGLGMTGPQVLAWDALLSLAFFVQHSGMVRRSFRTGLARTLPERFHSALYSVASGAMLLVVLALWQQSEWTVITLAPAAGWIVRVAFLAAVAGIAWGSRSLGSFDAFGTEPILRHLRGSRPRTGPLVIRGPYRWVRHPLYTCVLAMIWSSPHLPADRLLFNLLWTTWMVIGTVLEERDLVATFGADYREYQSRVPMLVPWTLRPWR